jgi:hypothetical protein
VVVVGAEAFDLVVGAEAVAVGTGVYKFHLRPLPKGQVTLQVPMIGPLQQGQVHDDVVGVEALLLLAQNVFAGSEALDLLEELFTPFEEELYEEYIRQHKQQKLQHKQVNQELRSQQKHSEPNAKEPLRQQHHHEPVLVEEDLSSVLEELLAPLEEDVDEIYIRQYQQQQLQHQQLNQKLRRQQQPQQQLRRQRRQNRLRKQRKRGLRQRKEQNLFVPIQYVPLEQQLLGRPQQQIDAAQQLLLQQQYQQPLRQQQQQQYSLRQQQQQHLLRQHQQQEQHLITHVQYVPLQQQLLRQQQNSAPTAIDSPMTTSEEKECVICMDETKSHVCVPCFHYCMCTSCSKNPPASCPMCRRKIERMQIIY